MANANPGDRFGRLVVIRQVDDYITQSGKKYPRILCKCDCGNEKIIDKRNLLKGFTQSCGCLRNERISAANKTHGDTDSRLYNVWSAMKRRCYNETVPEYKNYGGRGISMCDDWKDNYSSFKEWAYSTGYDDKAPRGQCTIDRIDVNGNYCPENCRWATVKEQMSNTRKNHQETYRGETHTIAEWGDILQIDPQKIRTRMQYGWSFQDAVEAPDDARTTRGQNRK